MSSEKEAAFSEKEEECAETASGPPSTTKCTDPDHQKHMQQHNWIYPVFLAIVALALSYGTSRLLLAASEQPKIAIGGRTIADRQCFNTCRISVAESLPTGLDFAAPELSTFEAWQKLIMMAQKDLMIAAYKSSLQGKHVLGDLDKEYSQEGDDIYAMLLDRGSHRNITIGMVESYPPKDKGDNEDGVLLEEYGRVVRKPLRVSTIMGRGKMHSKFLLADNKNFYLGSANLDWRSLNQKMELGFFVESCPCLGEDLRRIYDSYVDLSDGSPKENLGLTSALYNEDSPLLVKVEGEESRVFIAASPTQLNHAGRTHDLHAILDTINNAEKFIYIHVMDYFPLFVYRSPKEHWGVLDNALRAAIVRGVEVKLLTASLHYPNLITRFLISLQSLNHLSNSSSIEARILKVPAPEKSITVISRERRTHKKLLVTESTVVIGNSNWSGDYFESGTTGTAMVVEQKGEKRGLVRKMVVNFNRDFYSSYAHPVEEYFAKCVESKTASFCEGDKDPSLFAKQ